MLQQTQVCCDWGAGRARWLGHRTRDREVAGFESRQERREKVYSTWSTFCADSFRYPFHITALARKRSLSFCQKCRWQVTAKHAYTLCDFEWIDTVTWCIVEWCTQNLRRNGSISRGTSHAAATKRYQYTTSVDINNTRYKKDTVTHSESHANVRSESAREQRIALYKSYE